jgi:threonine synthase
MQIKVKDSNNQYYEVEESRWCGEDFSLLNLEKSFSGNEKLVDNRFQGLFRYRELLPINKDENIVSLGEGFTPLASSTLHKGLQMKLDFLFPTGSYKDRGAAVLLSKIKELKIPYIIEDSSGNAGCAIAAYSARAGISCKIIVPANASPAKIRQIAGYGAEVETINGTRDDVSEYTLNLAQQHYYASHCWNPFFFEGTKTFAFEIYEQTNGQLPENIVFPTGNGTLIIGVYIGFLELKELGLIDQIPKLYAAQAENCNSLTYDFNTQTTLTTVADGISVKKPVRKSQIVEVVNLTGAKILTVSEDEILEAHQLFNKEGIYAELTSGVALAAVLKHNLQKNTLIPITGSGLKNKI